VASGSCEAADTVEYLHCVEEKHVICMAGSDTYCSFRVSQGGRKPEFRISQLVCRRWTSAGRPRHRWPGRVQLKLDRQALPPGAPPRALPAASPATPSTAQMTARDIL
jgi:hypothetical protein